MEKWARSLSKTNALIYGVIGFLVSLAIVFVLYNLVGGLIGGILLGAVLGGGVGFSLPLIYKGLTGFTPKEKKELGQNSQSNLPK